MVRRAPLTARGREVARRNRARNLAGRRRGSGESFADPNSDPDRSRRRGGYSAPGPDPGTDPQLIGATLSEYIADRGWDAPLAHARVFAEWPALVGAEVAAHCRPQSLQDGQLRIVAESTAWATQLRLLGSAVLARLVAELGDGVVTRLHITGPTGPSWKHGTWSVRGARGPRDTYG